MLHAIKQTHLQLKHKIHQTKFIVSPNHLIYIKLFYVIIPFVIGGTVMNYVMNIESNNRAQWLPPFHGNNNGSAPIHIVAPPVKITSQHDAFHDITTHHNSNSHVQLYDNPLDWTYRRSAEQQKK